MEGGRGSGLGDVLDAITREDHGGLLLVLGRETTQRGGGTHAVSFKISPTSITVVLSLLLAVGKARARRRRATEEAPRRAGAYGRRERPVGVQSRVSGGCRQSPCFSVRTRSGGTKEKTYDCVDGPRTVPNRPDVSHFV